MISRMSEKLEEYYKPYEWELEEYFISSFFEYNKNEYIQEKPL